MAWWKYGSQPDQPIRDVNPTVNSGGLFRTQSNPKPVFKTSNGRRPTSTITIPISFKSQSVRNEYVMLQTGSTSVPLTPLPSISTSTTEQFKATPQRTHSIPVKQIPVQTATQPVRNLIKATGPKTASVSDILPLVSKTQPKDCPTVQRTLFKIGSITIKNELNEFVRVSVQVGFKKRIIPILNIQAIVLGCFL